MLYYAIALCNVIAWIGTDMDEKIYLHVKKIPFPEQVKIVRMYLQLSQEGLARCMGISYATVSRWERENRKPQLATLGKFYSFCRRNGIAIDLTDTADL